MLKWLSLFVLVLCTACSDRVSSEQGRSGVRYGDHPMPELPATMTTPSGRVIVPGTVDSLGYRLPLDLPWPKAEKIPGPHPSREEILARRTGGSTPFFEVRLGPDDAHTQNETTIDVAGDTLIVGWNNFTDTTLAMGVARSADGGQSWNESLFSEHVVTSDPVVRYGGDGRWFYAYIGQDLGAGTDYEIYLRRSLDDGITWSSPIAATNDALFDDKPYMDVHGDDVLFVYARLDGSFQVFAVGSTNAGLSFTNETRLSVTSKGGHLPAVAINDNGWFAFWRDSFQESIWIATSLDQGQNWSVDRPITSMSPLPNSTPEGFRMLNLPSAAASPVTNTLVVVWNDQHFGNPDIVAIRSTDDGLNWSSPVRVNDDSGIAHQFFPTINCDESGNFHVIWYDRRHGSGVDVYYGRSTDDGQSYDNIRVTANSFVPVLPWEGGAANFIGDYLGVAGTDSHGYPFYQDSREGNQDVYLSIIPLQSYSQTLAAWPFEISVLDLIDLLEP